MDQAYPKVIPRGKSEQQKKFARDAGVSWSTIQRVLDIERGKSLDILADLAAGLEVKVTDLLMPPITEPPDPFSNLSPQIPQNSAPTALRRPRY